MPRHTPPVVQLELDSAVIEKNLRDAMAKESGIRTGPVSLDELKHAFKTLTDLYKHPHDCPPLCATCGDIEQVKHVVADLALERDLLRWILRLAPAPEKLP